MNKKLLIDGDIVLYKIAFACQENLDFDNEIHRIFKKEEGISALNTWMTRMEGELDGEIAGVFLSCPSQNNFRLKILDTYKGNRKSIEKPIGHKFLKNYVKENYPCHEVDTLEADDLLGITVTKHPDEPWIIVSTDKDMETIPNVSIYNPDKDILHRFDNLWAFQNFMTQVLVGDSTDNYKGLPGCGPKHAENILEHLKTEKELWEAVLKAYKSKGLTVEDALVQARCARILQTQDYKNGEVILWHS